MTTLTPSQRLEAYRWAKLFFKKHDNGPFLCNVLFAHLGGYIGGSGWERKRDMLLKDNLPELMNQKPNKRAAPGGGWFVVGDDTSRHQVLDKCISEVEKLIEVKQ